MASWIFMRAFVARPHREYIKNEPAYPVMDMPACYLSCLSTALITLREQLQQRAQQQQQRCQ